MSNLPNSLRHHATRHHRIGSLSLLVACLMLNCAARAGGTIDTAIGTPGVQVSPFNLRGPRALAVFDRGNGPQLVAAGALGGGVPPSSGIRSMIFADGVDGLSLYITEGNSVNHKPVRRWNGTSWSTLGTQTIGGASPLVTALGRPDLGVFLAGWLYVGAQGTPGVHRWDGASWSAIAPLPASWTPARIAVEVVDGAIVVHATGPTSICPGGAGTCSYMHRWSNGAWTTVDGPTYIVEDLQWHDGGGGARLYACGLFDRVGDEPTGRLARLEGQTWTPVDHQVAGWPLGLASVDLGCGPELMVGGDFHFVDGLPTERVAGLSRGEVRTFAPDVTAQPLNATAFDLVWHDGGDGSALYVGGSFVAIDGAPAACVARWNGCCWQAIGSGMLGVVDGSDLGALLSAWTG